jgi:hypothetical protein
MAAVFTLLFLALLVGMGLVGAHALAQLVRGDFVTIDVRRPLDDR